MPRSFDEISTYRQPAQSWVDNLFSQIGNYIPQAGATFQKFLTPEGGQAFTNQAMQNYRQNILPEIFNAYGSEAGKNSSALNQALAGSAANLNTDLMSLLSQLQLQSAQGLGNLGLHSGQLGLQGSIRSFAPRQTSPLQQVLLGLINPASYFGGSLLSKLF